MPWPSQRKGDRPETGRTKVGPMLSVTIITPVLANSMTFITTMAITIVMMAVATIFDGHGGTGLLGPLTGYCPDGAAGQTDDVPSAVTEALLGPIGYFIQKTKQGRGCFLLSGSTDSAPIIFQRLFIVDMMRPAIAGRILSGSYGLRRTLKLTLAGAAVALTFLLVFAPYPILFAGGRAASFSAASGGGQAATYPVPVTSRAAIPPWSPTPGNNEIVLASPACIVNRNNLPFPASTTHEETTRFPSVRTEASLTYRCAALEFAATPAVIPGYFVNPFASSATYASSPADSAAAAPKKRERKEDYHLALGGDGPRLVLYIRVSSSKQAKGLSPEVQEQELLKLAKSLNPSHIYVFFDYAKTGTESTRRKTGVIIRLQKAGMVDELVVRHVDRAGREVWDLSDLCMPFIKKGGKVRTLKRVYEHNADDYAALSSEFVTAEKQSIHNTETMRSSKEASFLGGNWNHRYVPPGYRKKAGTKWIEKDPVWQDIMEIILKTFLDTHSFADVIMKVAREFKIIIKRDRLCNLLNNPVIYGRPRMMGAVKVDESLRYFTDEIEPKLTAILAEIELRHEKKADGIFAKMMAEDYTTLGPLLRKAHEHSLECGCHFVLNGTLADDDGLHINIICARKLHELTFPLTGRREESIGSDWSGIWREDGAATGDKNETEWVDRTPQKPCRHPNSPHFRYQGAGIVFCQKCRRGCSDLSHYRH